MKWILCSEEPYPLEIELLVTNGKEIILGYIDLVVDSHWLNSSGVSGYDMETNFTASEITHWMLAPELPK